MNPRAIRVRFAQDQALFQRSAAVHFCLVAAVVHLQEPDGVKPVTSVCASSHCPSPCPSHTSREMHLRFSRAQWGPEGLAQGPIRSWLFSTTRRQPRGVGSPSSQALSRLRRGLPRGREERAFKQAVRLPMAELRGARVLSRAELSAGELDELLPSSFRGHISAQW